jgi:hypothetical protein
MLGTSIHSRTTSETTLDREVDLIVRAVDENGRIERRDLARLVGARHWGPGRFSGALGEALAEGAIRRTGRSSFAPVRGNGNDASSG